jgi:hypothetical protein
VVGGKNGFVDAPELSTRKSRPFSPDTLTRGSASLVDVLPLAGDETFARSAVWMVEAVREGADARDPLDATFPRCCLPLWCSRSEPEGNEQLHGSQRITSWSLEHVRSVQIPPLCAVVQ